MDVSESLNRSSTWMALLASTGTLVCCALPILLVSLGLGAVVASTTYRFPFLVTLSEHPGLMFGGSAMLLALAGWFAFLRPSQCPVEPALASKCKRARRWNQRIWKMSVLMWVIGSSTRFVLPEFVHLFRGFGN
jgi:hypothetical protein